MSSYDDIDAVLGNVIESVEKTSEFFIDIGIAFSVGNVLDSGNALFSSYRLDAEIGRAHV